MEAAEYSKYLHLQSITRGFQGLSQGVRPQIDVTIA